MSRRRFFLLSYLAVLLLSNGARLIFPPDNTPTDEQFVFVTSPVGDKGGPPASVRMAYRVLGPEAAPPVLLIHGTPIASRAVMPLAQQLSSRFRVVVPDMPGFGGSSRRVPDYSFRSHAAYVNALLEELKLESVHVIGFSQGGGVALSLAGEWPSRVRSVTMMAAIGVQELELLGDYRLNRGLYLLQYGALLAVEWLVPHFGYLDTAVLNTAFARNVLDSDQRPLRRILEQYAEPMLILHGTEDRLVPLAAAQEHARIVPQSELVQVDAGHMVFKTQMSRVVEAFASFVQRTESGAALVRSTATSERIAAANLAFDKDGLLRYSGLTLAIVLLLLALSTYVSEDLACISAGLMVAHGTLSFVPATAACMLGIYSGDLLLFLAGRVFGPTALAGAPLNWFVSASQVERSREWFERRGPVVVFTSRFIPGTRLPTYFVAGMLRMSLLRFSTYFILAALIWTPLLVGAAYFLGEGAFDMFGQYQRYSLVAAGVLGIGLWLALRTLIPRIAKRHTKQ